MTIIRPASIADQVSALLRGRIRDGTYPPGGRLPSEAELCLDFGVSRATVRTVLAKMAAEGLILRKQGDGTYVNEHLQEVTTHPGDLWEIGQIIQSSGFTPSVQPVSSTERPPNQSEIQKLQLPEGELVLFLERLFHADQTPAILAYNAIPGRLLDPDAGPYDGGLSIREILWDYCHRKIAYAVSDLRSAMADEKVAEVLSIPESRPLLKIQITFYDRDNQPLACGHSFFNDSLLRLRLVQTWGG